MPILSGVIQHHQKNTGTVISKECKLSILSCLDGGSISLMDNMSVKTVTLIVAVTNYFLQKKIIYITKDPDDIQKYLDLFFIEDLLSFSIVTINDFISKSYKDYYNQKYHHNTIVIFEDINVFFAQSSVSYITTKQSMWSKKEISDIKRYAYSFRNYLELKTPIDNSIDIYKDFFSKSGISEIDYHIHIEPNLKYLKTGSNPALTADPKFNAVIAYKNSIPVTLPTKIIDSIGLTTLLTNYYHVVFIGHNINAFQYESKYRYGQQMLLLGDPQNDTLPTQNSREIQIEYEVILHQFRQKFIYMKNNFYIKDNVIKYIKQILEHNKTQYYFNNKSKTMYDISALNPDIKIQDIYKLNMQKIKYYNFLNKKSMEQPLESIINDFERDLLISYIKKIDPKKTEYIMLSMWGNFLHLYEYAKMDAFLSKYGRKKEPETLMQLTFYYFDHIFIKSFLKFF